jgi:hypothetical protein
MQVCNPLFLKLRALCTCQPQTLRATRYTLPLHTTVTADPSPHSFDTRSVLSGPTCVAGDTTEDMPKASHRTHCVAGLWLRHSRCTSLDREGDIAAAMKYKVLETDNDRKAIPRAA